MPDERVIFAVSGQLTGLALSHLEVSHWVKPDIFMSAL